MDTAGENARGIHARMVLQGRSDFTLEGLMSAAFDSYLPAFARLIPLLVDSYRQLPDTDARKDELREQVALLQGWNDRWSLDSTQTSLAVFWADELQHSAGALAQDAGMKVLDYAAGRASGDVLLAALATASQRLTEDFGSWRTPWGDINRFQRLSDAIDATFDDNQPSTPVPFTSGEFGSLASFGARRREGTRRFYGTSGNSFVGGESGTPGTPHFNDEAGRYARGDLREVYFYPSQLQGHTERTYHPGE
jgi:acyl-homoserine-lactone acylase